ncbi:MAG: biotin/lipoyl-binding protein [Cyclobacteriaceae bacterium]|nr:biotin/lipoyl-binding protein [Cyclobacteriaceae bacterium]
MFSVIIKDKSFSVEKTDKGTLVSGKNLNWDLQPIDTKRFHLINGNQSMEAELVSLDRESKTLQIRLNKKVVSVSLKDRFDLLLEEMGMEDQGSASIQDIKAPMPGLILDLKVKPGDEVKKGDVVLILEAMKMENIIKSPGDGIVSDVKVSLKQSVEKNQVLITF